MGNTQWTLPSGYYPTLIMGLAKDVRQGRAWVKVQLGITSESQHAAQIVEYWRSLKQAARHVERAIRMYYALQVGDTSLLKEYFPLLTLNGIKAVTPELHMLDDSPGEVRAAQRGDDEDVDDFMSSLGLD